MELLIFMEMHLQESIDIKPTINHVILLLKVTYMSKHFLENPSSLA